MPVRFRFLVVFAVLAAMVTFAAPHRADAKSVPTCKGKVATIVMTAGVPVTVNGDNEVVVGTSGADSITVNGYNVLVCAFGGDDSVYLYGEDDVAYLGAGNDCGYAQNGSQLYGESGNDELTVDDAYANGGSGDDGISVCDGGVGDGGSGNDWISGWGAWSLYGGSGNDNVESHYTGDTVDCGTNVDNYSTDGYEQTLKRCENNVD